MFQSAESLQMQENPRLRSNARAIAWDPLAALLTEARAIEGKASSVGGGTLEKLFNP